ncbi:MAG: hypothetical protein V7739_10365 [Motiliproteus sp.]
MTEDTELPNSERINSEIYYRHLDTLNAQQPVQPAMISSPIPARYLWPQAAAGA